jgi:aldehyde:ferredoxin oxidoreductase
VDKGEALGILAETRGSGHTLSTPGRMARLTPQRAKEIYGTEKAADPHAYEGKPEMVALSERHKAMLDCFGICFFSEAVQDCLLEYLFSTRDSRNCMAAHAQMVAAATGWDVTKEELGVVAERMMAVEQSINILAGIRREHEMPPRRFFEPIPGGRSKGMALDRGKTAEMLARHSALHGWDPQTGVPTRARLLDLGLPEVAARLEGFFASP